MGRPNLTAVRRREIFDAFEECILKFGLEGSTLELIADQAGMKRSVVRHYTGNREELIRDFVDDFIRRTQQAQDEALCETQPEVAFGNLIDLIAGPRFADPREDALLDALMAASHRDPELRAQLREVYRTFRRAIAKHLRATSPSASAPAIRQAAHALMCLAYGHATMSDLGLATHELRHVRDAAHSILDSLGTVDIRR